MPSGWAGDTCIGTVPDVPVDQQGAATKMVIRIAGRVGADRDDITNTLGALGLPMPGGAGALAERDGD